LALTGSVLKSKVPLVRTMLPMGSPVYMSPEQIRASKNIDERTDIWSIGCVLYELLTGKAAFDAPSLTQLSASILEQEPAPIGQTHPEVPAELEAVVARCIEKDPNNRYQHIAELAMALYPFGPRRSRIYAERCCRLLKVPGTTHAEFELPSVRPPSWDGLASGSFPATQQLVAPLATGPVTKEEIKSFHPVYRSKRMVWIVAGALSIIAAFFGLIGRLGSSTVGNKEKSAAATLAPLKAVLLPAPVAATAMASAEVKGSLATPTVVSASAVTTENRESEQVVAVTKLPLVSFPTVQRRAQTRVARPKKAAGGGSLASSSADPDPGF
jgi:serine/threonine-protein kinase